MSIDKSQPASPSEANLFQAAHNHAAAAFSSELQQHHSLASEQTGHSHPPHADHAEHSYTSHTVHESHSYHLLSYHAFSHHSGSYNPAHQTYHPAHGSHSWHRPATHHVESENIEIPQLEAYNSRHLSTGQSERIGNDLAGRIVKTVGHNEGALTNVTRNDNGHGISVGIRQWNQRSGELPDLFKAMHEQDPQKFAAIFGPYSSHLMQSAWVRQADMAGNPDFLRRLRTALHDNEFQQVQIDLARQFADKSIQTASHYGLRTEQGAALLADITNQLGEGGARRVLAESGLRPGGTVHNEKLALQRMEHFSYRPNSRDRFNTVAYNFKSGQLIGGSAENDHPFSA